MKRFFEIQVERDQTLGTVAVRDGKLQLAEPVFDELRYYCARHGFYRWEEDRKMYDPAWERFLVRLVVGSYEVRNFFQKMASLGLAPTRDYIPDGPTDFFPLYILRNYSGEELEAFAFLYLRGFGVTVEGGRGSDGQWVGSKAAFDRLPVAPEVFSFGPFTYLVSSRVRRKLEETGCAGCAFEELHWDDGSGSDFWFLRSELEMPACVSPVQKRGGMLEYFKNGHHLPEPLYRADDVEGLGDGGVFRCRERLGSSEIRGVGSEGLILSQKLYRIFRESASDGIDVMPVRVV